ncbi:MAG: chromosome segregation protein SMC [Actinomycetota bacterium]|nr:chromosome segregation protein SMC [Actinomycetota bacterium]
MFLRSLTLRGFKSFADKTSLEFTPGISVIVGPNGSGKSNLVDAISWVLGEQGPRALRGGHMADVIYAGSPARAALGMAEVHLVIDNSAGVIPVPLAELEISRTIFRSGESEYRIGGQACRLLDIQELLSAAGVGRALHTVVGQGQLEDVLTARPEERRQYVEEAAGIAKHRRRRERAERRLGSLEQDLLRLQDVLGELRRQLRPLKQQAEMATRHEQLTSQAGELAWRLAAARLRVLHAERKDRLAGWEEGVARRAQARERLEALDAELAAIAADREEASAALREAEAAHRAAEEARSEAERSLRAAVDRVSEARSGLAQAATHAARRSTIDEDLARADAALAETVSALEERERELEGAEREHHAAERARREAEEERRRLSEDAAVRRAEIETLQRSLASAERERERLEHGLAEVRTRIAAAREEQEALESDIERLDAAETPLSERQGRLERERQQLQAEAASLEEAIRGLEHRRSLLEARRLDMEETPGSRFLAAHRGRAVGLLRDLVRVEPGLERALAAALGPFADAVVYADRESALADAPGGEGALLGVPFDVPPAPALPGERSLSSAIGAEPSARALVSLVLRDVYLAGSLSEAEARQRAHPRCSFVTTDGILVGPAMVRTAAESDARAQALRIEVQAVDRELAGARAALRPKAARLEELRREAESVGAELDRHDAMITAAADRMGRLGADLSSLAKEEELLAERLGGLDDAAAAWRESLAAGQPVHHQELPSLPSSPEPPMALRVEVETLRRDRTRLEESLARLHREREALAGTDPRVLQEALEAAEESRRHAEFALRAAEDGLDEAANGRNGAAGRDRDTTEAEATANRAWRERAAELDRLREEYERQDRDRADLERRIDEAERLLRDGHGRDLDQALGQLTDEDTPHALERRSELVARRLGLLGKVNLLAGGEYSALQERHDFLAREIDDVRKARRDLLEVIRRVDEEITTLFEAAFRDVDAEFRRLFGGLFPGGEGRLLLTDEADLLSTGIEVEARPGRKRVKRISLLSGGERALTALAFLFAIFRARPSPFYLLDEVEAALDDVNLHRFLDLIKGFAQTSQVLVVTHQKRTMEVADVLYGVSMGREGSSTVVCQRLEHPQGRSEGDDVVVIPEPEPQPEPLPEPDTVR